MNHTSEEIIDPETRQLMDRMRDRAMKIVNMALMTPFVSGHVEHLLEVLDCGKLNSKHIAIVVEEVLAQIRNLPKFKERRPGAR